MSIPSVVPRSVPVAARAPRPASRRLLRGMAVASLAAAPLLATPRPVAASTPETYLACVNYVADWTIACASASDTWYGDLACEATGVIGIIGCALLEAGEILSGSVKLPPME